MDDLGFEASRGAFTYRVAALIIDQGRLLVVKHMDHPCYYTVGGRVKFGETSEEAVIREVMEETGLALPVDRLAFVQERFLELAGRKHHEIVFFYVMKGDLEIDLGRRRFTDQGPREALHWLPIDELAHYDIVPAFLKARVASLGELTGIEHVVSRED